MKKIRKTIKEHELIEKNMHIVLGLSGGPDSVCLFHVLLRLRRELGITVHPVHLNHRFRPGAAEEDQAYVESLCRENGLECRTFVVDCNRLAEEQGMTSEEAGRMARYDAFYSVAEEVAERLADQEQQAKADVRSRIRIAVAQNADDQAETILFRLLRGTGVDGLAGIAYKRQERGFQVIRPLLDITREEIEAYCDEQKLHPVTDHTNELPVYARNKIRLELLPYLEENYNPNIKESLTRLGRIAADDKDYLWQTAESAYRELAINTAAAASFGKSTPETAGGEVLLDRRGLRQLHRAIRHRVLLKAFDQVGLGSDISEERLTSADDLIEAGQGGKVLEFPHGYRLTVGSGRVRIYRER
ncbi:MAG: tRNA lysidine(34) synthetase TilS [Bacillota bacterium]|nr:tRNA lysidine(34) synthetase TilS [Bacillota bacterium]